MAVVMKKCRVCGKEYKPCHTAKSGNTFRWQDVACSPECGSVYLERVAAARSKTAQTGDASFVKDTAAENQVATYTAVPEPDTDEQYETTLTEYFDDETDE